MIKNYKYRIVFLLILPLLFISCNLQIDIYTKKTNPTSKNTISIIFKNTEESSYIGWWIYGENQHIYKDEKSLEEWDLEFPNEKMEELKELYLAVCEMEYFPMECKMIGSKKKNILTNETTLIVKEFNILHVEGCGEQ